MRRKNPETSGENKGKGENSKKIIKNPRNYEKKTEENEEKEGK